MTARLRAAGLTGGRSAAACFRDLDLAVDAGQVMALLGPNGAGKSTLLLTLAGLLPAHEGEVMVDGTAVRSGDPVAASRAGVVLVPDDRALFPSLTVAEHLAVARSRRGPDPRASLDAFPALEARWDLPAGALSGGEQQMLAIARALIQQPRVLLIDEMSMGLAPLVVGVLFDALRRVADEQGAAIVLVEQHVHLALEVADVAVVLQRGTVVLSDAAASLRSTPERLQRAYFGDPGNEASALR